MSPQPLGLYVHIPFCSAICNYCNFNRGLFDEGLKARYLSALTQEIVRAGQQGRADTIFFGGGTPSLLEPSEVRQIIAACGEAFDLAADAEVTLEANPESVTLERLGAFREAGITRLSFGVQSFRDDELARLSRLHTAGRARQAFEWARVAGFDNVSLDLMIWLPAQRVADARESVRALIDLGPDHVSVYMLEIYPNAPLRDEMARGRWSVAPDDDVAEMYLEGFGRLDQAGYQQYEISNAARPGKPSRHNLKYWQDGEWLGFGCGAHSTFDGVRWKNVSATGEYIERVMAGADLEVEHRRLSPAERVEEAMFTGLRLNAGVDLSAVSARYGIEVWRTYGERLAPYLDGGWLVREDERLRLTREGMLLAHEIMTVFV